VFTNTFTVIAVMTNLVIRLYWQVLL